MKKHPTYFSSVNLMSATQSIQFKFSEKIDIPLSQVFFLTPLTYCFVNIRPVHPGLEH